MQVIAVAWLGCRAVAPVQSGILVGGTKEQRGQAVEQVQDLGRGSARLAYRKNNVLKWPSKKESNRWHITTSSWEEPTKDGCCEFAVRESHRFLSVPRGHFCIIYESSVETVKHKLKRLTLSCHISSVISAGVYLCQCAWLYFIFHFRDSVNLIRVLWHSLCLDLGCSSVMLTLCYLNILQHQHKRRTAASFPNFSAHALSSKYKVIYFSWQHGFQEPLKCPFVSLNHCVALHEVSVWQGTCCVRSKIPKLTMWVIAGFKCSFFDD